MGDRDLNEQLRKCVCVEFPWNCISSLPLEFHGCSLKLTGTILLRKERLICTAGRKEDHRPQIFYKRLRNRTT